MSIPIFNKNAWIEFNGMPKNPGINPSTHLATIQDGGGNKHKCFVKLLPQDINPGLFCEYLGWILSGALGITRPNFVAIVEVPIDRLSTNPEIELPEKLKKLSTCAAWCTEAIDAKSIANIGWFERLFSSDALFRDQCIIKMAAFDLWTDLKDRNFGNILKNQSNHYYAIDHETMLHDILWKNIFGICYEERSLFKSAKGRLSENKFKDFTSAIIENSNNHYQAWQMSKTAVEDGFDRIYPKINAKLAQSIKDQISSFLSLRATVGWMENQLGVLI